MMIKQGVMRKKPNGFGVVAMVGKPTGRAPRRLGAARGPDPKLRVNPDDRRKARKAQRVARRVTRSAR